MLPGTYPRDSAWRFGDDLAAQIWKFDNGYLRKQLIQVLGYCIYCGEGRVCRCSPLQSFLANFGNTKGCDPSKYYVPSIGIRGDHLSFGYTWGIEPNWRDANLHCASTEVIRPHRDELVEMLRTCGYPDRRIFFAHGGGITESHILFNCDVVADELRQVLLRSKQWIQINPNKFEHLKSREIARQAYLQKYSLKDSEVPWKYEVDNLGWLPYKSACVHYSVNKV